jgi:hypothetical protein
VARPNTRTKRQRVDCLAIEWHAPIPARSASEWIVQDQPDYKYGAPASALFERFLPNIHSLALRAGIIASQAMGQWAQSKYYAIWSVRLAGFRNKVQKQGSRVLTGIRIMLSEEIRPTRER